MKTIFLIHLFLIMCAVSGYTQTRTIVGTITDKETAEPIPFASVLLKDHSIGTFSDVDGKFTMTIPEKDDSLEVSYVGYENTVVFIPLGLDTLSISLNTSTSMLMSIVVEERVMDVSPMKMESSKKYRKDRSSAMYYSSPGVSSDSREADISSYTLNNISAGQLTAGEVNDFQKWKLWGDITESELKSYKSVWSMLPKYRYLFQLENKYKMPVVDAKVTLCNANGNKLWEACTDNTGKAELWAALFTEDEKMNNLSVKVQYQGKSYKYENASEFQNGVNFLEIPVECAMQNNVDIAFVVDATGSMSDELEYLKVELTDVISKVKDSLPWAKIRLATVFYRDIGDAYVTKYKDFTDNIEDAISFIREQSAGGGGDQPEAVDSALGIVVNKLSWSSEAASRLAFMVLDASPHSERPQVIANLKKIIPNISEKGIRMIPVACSGIEKSTEYFLRSLALATNGTYVFLTDDSGIGFSHIKPTTDKYDVELLNAALIRIISAFSKIEECKPLNTENIDSLKLDTTVVNMPSTDSSKISSNDTLIGDSALVIWQDIMPVSWKYYPNPTNGELNIEIMNLPESTEGEIYFTDITGKVLMRFSINERKNIKTDVSEFPTGTYLLRVLYNKDKWLTGKVILFH